MSVRFGGVWRRDLGRGRRRRRERLADGKAHRGDLLELIDDDLLGNAPDLLVAPVAKHRLGHVDGALMMRNHHGDEVAIDVARRFHRHVVHHLRHGGVVFGEIRRFIARCVR
jgi:hypothetical protein